MRESIIKRMREKGLKVTPQRLAVIDVLVGKTILHPSADLIYREARKKGKRLSLSTVYSILNEFSKQGIIKMLEFYKMENRYETNMTEHINLVCRSCKKIMDYKVPFRVDPKEFANKSVFFVTDSRFEYYGYCEECRKKAPSGSA